MFKSLITWTTHYSIPLEQMGITLMRLSIGIMFLTFGCNKLLSSSSNLAQLGSAMSYFGITRGYLFWGYTAALAEFCGGIAYMLGFYTRIVSLPLIWLLIVALKFHLHRGDAITIWAFPAICLCLIVGFFISGSGIYSIDYLMNRSS